MFRLSAAFLLKKSRHCRYSFRAPVKHRSGTTTGTDIFWSLFSTLDPIGDDVSLLPTVFQSNLNKILETASTGRSSNRTSAKTLFLLGVSGGSDSVALFHLMRSSSQQLLIDPSSPCQLHVVHFDHQQRGEASNKDRELVQKLCNDYQVPFHCYLWSQQQQVVVSTFSQETARNWRRATMKHLLKDLLHDQSSNTLGILLTAHHLNDSNETLLLKLLRGAHITNLQGMELVTIDSDDGIVWGRPLLSIPKEMLVNYLQTHNYTWREDESNQTNKYLRNRVRNELLPLLTDLVGGEEILQRRLDYLSQQSHDMQLHMTSQAKKYLLESGSRYGYFYLPQNWDVVAQHALHLWVTSQQPTVDFSYEQLQRVCTQLCKNPNKRQWRLDVGQKWSVVRQGEVLLLQPENQDVVLAADKRGEVRDLKWSVVSDDQGLDSGDTTESLVLQIPYHLLSSSRKTRFVSTTANHSMYFHPPWRNRAIPLTDFLRGQKVPLHQRTQAPVVMTLLEGADAVSSLVAAVYVSTKKQWFADARFFLSGKDRIPVRVRLEASPETSHNNVQSGK